jgi:ribonuclease D
MAVVRSLWLRRDEIARRRDTSPGRVLPDSAIVAAALAAPAGQPLEEVPAFHGRGARRHLRDWEAAVAAALALPDSELPPPALPSDGPPPPRSWPERDPDAAARLAATRADLSTLAESRELPLENLLSPDLVRRLAWRPPAPLDHDHVVSALAAGGARRWQIALTAPVLVADLARTAADVALDQAEPAGPDDAAEA